MLAVLVLACGTALGAGLCLLGGAFLAWRRPSLAERVAPHVARYSAVAFDTATRPVVRGQRSAWVFRRLSSLFPSLRESLSRVLERTETDASVESFLRRVMSRGGLGCLVGVAVAVAAICVGAELRLGLASIIAGFACGGGLVVWRLVLRDRAVRAHIARELPVILGFVATALRAGETLPRALERVTAHASGRLSRELSGAVASLGLGVRLEEALDVVARRLAMSDVTASVSVITSALAAGTPVAEALTIRVDELTQRSSQRQIERASRQEVGMLIPLVFLVLPVTVAFAVLPGLLALDAGLGLG